MTHDTATPTPAERMLRYIDQSPTPHHAVASARAILDAAGFVALDLGSAWGEEVSGPCYVARDGALVAWASGRDASPSAPVRMIGAHTDSPGLRIRPRPDRSVAGWRQLAVEVYGGALLNSWLDRDLGLAGTVAIRSDGDNPSSTSSGVETRGFRTDGAVMRVPQLAIHLDRGISSDGLRLDPQQDMTPTWGLGASTDGEFREWLASQVGCTSDNVLSWEVMAFDIQPGAVLGVDAELLAAPRLDDQACCWAAIEALGRLGRSGLPPSHASVVVLNDHEEVGSATATGADGSWLEQVLERRTVALGGNRTDLLLSLAGSMLLSADMAHATHPNRPERHEPGHWIRAGGGPVIKHNVNARYATTSRSAAEFTVACAGAGIDVQQYSHRGDIPCGSTIGPLTAARLAVDTVDVGMPMLSMHSARELMATADVEQMLAAFTAWFDPVRR